MSQPDQVTDSNWKSLYKISGAAALIVVLAALIDIISTLLPEGYPITESVVEWFMLVLAENGHLFSFQGFLHEAIGMKMS